MLQELLNRSDDFLWALLSNGSVLRLLRDSTVLTGQAYVEFDLEAIFDGEIFSDFVCMYLLCHATRFSPIGDGGQASCYLEQWRAFAADQGQRALAQLRRGVEQAISHLGTGFLSHPDNQHLRARLDPRSRELRIEDFNRSLLRLIYRLLFWFVAEDRDVLLDPGPDDPDAETAQRLRLARQRYETYFSSARLRKLARTRRGDRHGDLYEAVQVVFDALGSEGGVPPLTLPGIGGIFETELPQGRPLPLDEPLAGARLSNQALLSAVRALAIVTPREGGARRPVDFGNLGAEELGSVYEGLLEQIPRYNDETRAYTLETLPGHERKETGSYYTPASLVDCLLDSALDPLLDEACAKPTPAERIAALFDITVCDPACGSGHFLVAAARRIAKRIAAEETGESEPPAAVVRAALRRVVGRCIYGVDINPMAAELAKVSLWVEAMEPGKPLSYLDQNIRVGNSLLGVTPALLAEGLPDAAFSRDRRRRPQGCVGPEEAERLRARRPARPLQPGWHPSHQRRPGQTSRRDRSYAARQPGRPAYSPATAGAGTRRITRTPRPEVPRRRLVRGIRATENCRHPRHRDYPGGPRTARRGRRHARTSRSRRTDHRPHPPVPLLPLARRVPAHLPRRQWCQGRRPSHRMGGRLLLRHRQSSLGAGKAPGTGVFRLPQSGDRERRERGSAQENDHRPR